MLLRLFYPKEKKYVDIVSKDSENFMLRGERKTLGESTVNFLNFDIKGNMSDIEILSSQLPGDSKESMSINEELTDMNPFFSVLLVEYQRCKGDFEEYITDIQNMLNKYINLALTDTQYYDFDFFYYLVQRSLFNNDYTRIRKKRAFHHDVSSFYNTKSNDNYLEFAETERFKAGFGGIEEIKAAYFEGNTGESGICYEVDHLIDAYLVEMLELFKRGMIIKKCKNCGKYFIPMRSDALYCNNISPQDVNKSCKEYGAYEQYKQNIKADEVKKLYRNIYMKKQMAYKRNPDIGQYQVNFEKFKNSSKEWKNEVRKGTKSENDFLQWLKNIK